MMLGTDVRVKSESVENLKRKKFLLYVSPVVLGSRVISSYKKSWTVSYPTASFLTSFHFLVTLNKDSFTFLLVLHDHHIILASAQFLTTVRPKSAKKSSNDPEKLVTYSKEKYVSKKLRKKFKLFAKQLTQSFLRIQIF